MEAAGKAHFGAFCAVEGTRSWLGGPHDGHDGRVMGGVLEVYLGCEAIGCEVEEFNAERVILRVNRAALEKRMPKQTGAYLAFWNGMVKTLVSAEWFVWEDADENAPDVVRVMIAKKIDKFC